MAIVSFADQTTEAFFLTGRAGPRVRWRRVARGARRKLDMLHFAHQLIDLRSPPGNRLEALRGDLAGFYSIRINDQWRVLFRWTTAGPAEVSIRDYH
jgi:toxin HigB-1